MKTLGQTIAETCFHLGERQPEIGQKCHWFSNRRGLGAVGIYNGMENPLEPDRGYASRAYPFQFEYWIPQEEEPKP